MALAVGTWGGGHASETCNPSKYPPQLLFKFGGMGRGWGGGMEEEGGGVRVLCQRAIHSFHITTLHCFCEMTARAARTSAVTADDCKGTKSF